MRIEAVASQIETVEHSLSLRPVVYSDDFRAMLKSHRTTAKRALKNVLVGDEVAVLPHIFQFDGVIVSKGPFNFRRPVEIPTRSAHWFQKERIDFQFTSSRVERPHQIEEQRF